jgi:hypothetical protein
MGTALRLNITFKSVLLVSARTPIALRVVASRDVAALLPAF